MKPRILLPAIMALALISPAAWAGNPTPRPRVHHHTVIESVSADSITVDDPGGAKSYKINKDTEITFQGNDITADQLQVGMRVEVTPDAVDDSLAGVIQADDPPSAAPARK